MRLIPIVLLTTLSLTACNSTLDRGKQAGTKIGEARATTVLPEYPDRCRKKQPLGFRKGVRLDVALKRARERIRVANSQADDCAAWYDAIRLGFMAA